MNADLIKALRCKEYFDLCNVESCRYHLTNTKSGSKCAIKLMATDAAAALDALRAQPENRPPCYFPEKDNPYPLCIGREMTACAHCCLWADYEPEQDESRVNNPLTPDELSTLEGEPVWIKQCANVYCKVLARFINPVCYEARRFNFTDGTVLHLVNYNADWLAYRAKPKEEV